jgi:hypothetical protein
MRSLRQSRTHAETGHMRYQVTALFDQPVVAEASRSGANSEAERIFVDKGESAARRWQWRRPPAEKPAVVRLSISAPVIYRYAVYQVDTRTDVEFVRLEGRLGGLIDGRPLTAHGGGTEGGRLTESEAVEIVRNEVANWMVKRSASGGILITLGSGDQMRSTTIPIKGGDDEHMVRLRAIKAMRTLQDEIADRHSAELSGQLTVGHC